MSQKNTRGLSLYSSLALNTRQQLLAVQPQKDWPLLWNLSTTIATFLGLLFRTQGAWPKVTQLVRVWATKNVPLSPLLQCRQPLPSCGRSKEIPHLSPSQPAQPGSCLIPHPAHCLPRPEEWDRSGEIIFLEMEVGRKGDEKEEKERERERKSSEG